MPAVNIAEKKDQFDVSLAAPGMKKEDFNIAHLFQRNGQEAIKQIIKDTLLFY